MPAALSITGQFRSTLNCLASAFAASSSATALALLPAHLGKDAEHADHYPSTHPERLSLRPRLDSDKGGRAQRRKPALDVERAVAAATARHARARRSGRAIGSADTHSDSPERGRPISSEAPSWTYSPTPARSPLGAPAPPQTSRRRTLRSPINPSSESFGVSPSSQAVRWFSTSGGGRQTALERHDSPTASPLYPASQPPKRSFVASPATPVPSFGEAVPPSPVPTSMKVEPTTTTSATESVPHAGLPGPSSSAQRPIRPPSPYGEINDLARHPLLYDPVLAPRFPIILCHGE